MLNKSENSLSGMIWTERLKRIILPKVSECFMEDAHNHQKLQALQDTFLVPRLVTF